jgi:hypothetical protein
MNRIIVLSILVLFFVIGCGYLDEKNMTPEEKAKIQQANEEYQRQQRK